MNRADPSPEQQTLTLQQALELAVRHHSAGELPKSENICQQILQTDPDQPVVLHLLGIISHQVGENDRAALLITKALMIRPNYAEALANLGNVLRELDQPDDAVTNYYKAVAIKPDFAEAHSNLGDVLKELERPDEAVIHCQKALEIKPNMAEAHNNLGNALQELGRLEEALAHYQKALEIKPEYAKAHNNLGVTFQRLGMLEEAVEFYHKTLNLNPDFAEAHNNLGNGLRELGLLNEGIASYRKALEIKPDYTEAHSNLGNGLRDLGCPDDAVSSYQQALAIKPDFAEAINNLWLSMLPMCHDIITNHRDTSSIEQIIDKLPTPPEPDILRLRFKSLTGGNAQEAWENVVRNMSTIQSETIFNGNKTISPSAIISENQSQRNMVALLHFGRSGSGYLHSLLDGHPNVSTLPGIYMSGFFGREVWARISSNGFQGSPEQFSSLYKVLFDARNPDKIPPAFIGDIYTNNSVGKAEGFVEMGSNRDTSLTLDRSQFLENLREAISGLEDLNHGQFFEAIHHAYEKTLGYSFCDKRLIFYHLHTIDPYSMANFLKYFPNAQLLMIIRHPVQSCESWVLKSVNDKHENAYKTYAEIVSRISSMLMIQNNPVFMSQDCAAVRLEDIKTYPEETLRRLCAYLDIEEKASLYVSTMQGLKWWGDPSSSLFGRTHDTESWEDDPIRVRTGSFFSSVDKFVLDTLFYPLSARFGYAEENYLQFRKDLAEIRLLIDKPLDFEKTLAKDFLPGYPKLEKTEAFKYLHAVLIGLWHLLDKHGTYLYLFKGFPE